MCYWNNKLDWLIGVVKVVMWSRGGLTWRSHVGANPIPIPHPTNLALFGHKITLYRFNQRGSYYRRGAQIGAGGLSPSGPLTLSDGDNLLAVVTDACWQGWAVSSGRWRSPTTELKKETTRNSNSSSKTPQTPSWETPIRFKSILSTLKTVSQVYWDWSYLTE